MKQQTQTPIKTEIRMMKVGSKVSYPIDKMDTVKVYASDLKKKRIGQYRTQTTDTQIIVTRLN